MEIEKIIQIIFGIVCLIGCIYQLNDFFVLYAKFETTVQISTEYPRNISFPAITICANNRIVKEKFCELEPIHCLPDEYDRLSMNIVWYLEDANSSEILRVSHNSRGKYKLFRLCNQEPIMDQSYCNYVSSFCGTYTGCRTYNYRNYSLESKVNFSKALSIDLAFYEKTFMEPFENYAVKYVVHENTHIPDISEEFEEIFPEQAHFVHLQKLTTILLPKPYHTECHDYVKEWKKNHSLPITRENCVQDCIHRDFIQLCGCLNYMNVIPEWKFHLKCTNAINTTKGFCKTLTSMAAVSPMIGRCQDSCPRDCKANTYAIRISKKRLWRRAPRGFGLSSQDNDSKIVLSYPRNEHTTYEYKPRIDDIELFSYIGGFTGVWLGASLFSTFFHFKNIVNLGLDRFRKRNSIREIKQKSSSVSKRNNTEKLSLDSEQSRVE